MAVTANQLIVLQTPERNSLPVYQSIHIYEGTLVFVNSSGYAVGVTGSGVNAFAGVAKREADNSSGSSGDVNVELLTEGIVTLVGSGFTQADVGKDCFADDNYTIVIADGANSVRIGKVVGYVSATKLRVMLQTRGFVQQTALTAADGGTVDGTYGAAEASVIQNLVIRVGELETKLKALGLLA